MKMSMCSVYDSVAGAFHTPMFFTSKAQAVRSFSDAVKSEETEFYKHPEDYTLFCLGEFDPETGNVVIYEAKESLGAAINYVADLKVMEA